MRTLKLWLFAALMAGALLPPSARSESVELTVTGDLSFWWVISEQNENGTLQQGANHPAAQEASGFRLNRARIVLAPSLPVYKLYARVQLELAGEVEPLDVWVAWKPVPIFGTYIGQMKIPSTYEVAQDEFLLDFINRSTFSRTVVNYTLADTPYDSSFSGLSAHNRDMGIEFKGAWNAGQSWEVLRYFVMVGNGLGANLNIGGNESTGFLINNNFGDYLYGARIEVSPFEWMTLGGYYDYNYHSNMRFRDKQTVVDLGRESWDIDAQVRLPWGFRAVGLYGQGQIHDYWPTLGRENYEYSGWEAKVLKEFFNDKLELGVRYDTFSYEFTNSGKKADENHWTFGVNYRPVDQVRLQLNYVMKDTVQPYLPDLKDNIVYLNVEMNVSGGVGLAALKKK